MQDISIDNGSNGLTQSQQTQILVSVPAKVTTKKVKSAVKVAIERRRVVAKRKTDKPYEPAKAGPLANLFYWLESPNLYASLHPRRRQSQNIDTSSCILCENNVCFGISHYKQLPFGWLLEDCKIIGFERRIAKLQAQNYVNEDKLTSLIEAKRTAWHNRQQIQAEINALFDVVQPIRRQIHALEDAITTQEIAVLPLELSINGIKI